MRGGIGLFVVAVVLTYGGALVILAGWLYVAPGYVMRQLRITSAASSSLTQPGLVARLSEAGAARGPNANGVVAARRGDRVVSARYWRIKIATVWPDDGAEVE